MSDILSTSDPEIQLAKDLRDGIDEDIDLTTIKLNWTVDFRQDLREIGASPDFPVSMTKAGIIVIDRAETTCREYMAESGLSYISKFNKLQYATERDTKYRSKMSYWCDVITKMGMFELGESRDTDYRMHISKDTSTKMDTIGFDFGWNKRQRAIFSLSVLVENCTKVFSPGTRDEASNVVRNVEYQLEDRIDGIAANCKLLGSCYGDCVADGAIYKERSDGVLSEIRNYAEEGRAYGDILIESFQEGLDKSDANITVWEK